VNPLLDTSVGRPFPPPPPPPSEQDAPSLLSVSRSPTARSISVVVQEASRGVNIISRLMADAVKLDLKVRNGL
jgi:hypothetical protein